MSAEKRKLQKRGQVLHFSLITGKMGQIAISPFVSLYTYFSPFSSLPLISKKRNSLVGSLCTLCISLAVFLGPFHLYCRYYMYFSEISCTSAEAGHRPYSMKFFKSYKQLSCCGWKVLCALWYPRFSAS